MSPRVVLAVDGNSLVHRSFHAQAATGLRDDTGRPMWAVRGLMMQVIAAVERIDPDCVIVGFDDPDSSRRRDRWPTYKSQRGEKLPTLVDQLALAQQMLTDLGAAVIVPDGLEADDVLATVATTTTARGDHTVVVTSDRDSFALINDHTRVLRIINGGVEASPLLTAPRLASMIGVGPEQYPDFAALRGDPSDNLPGIRGIGPKTAARLLGRFADVEAALADFDQGGEQLREVLGERCAALLADPAAREIWQLNRQVMAMHTDVAEVLALAPEAGALPFPLAGVTATCRGLQLTGSEARARRSLARDDSAPAVPPPSYHHDNASTETFAADRGSGWRSRPGARRPVRIAERVAPRDEQLALF